MEWEGKNSHTAAGWVLTQHRAALGEQGVLARKDPRQARQQTDLEPLLLHVLMYKIKRGSQTFRYCRKM